MEIGDILAWERSFTVEEVAAFCRVTGDLARHHTEPDPAGRLMVPGLLTASLPTRIGGTLDFLVQEATFEFRRPVWTGERIRCEVTITDLTADGDRTRMHADLRCFRPGGREVLVGRCRGFVPAPLLEVRARPASLLPDP